VRFTRAAGLALCIGGLLLVGRGLFEVAGGRIYQELHGRQVDRELEIATALPQQAQSQPEQPRRVSYALGSAIGRLEIPRLGLSAVVLEGSDTGTLRLGVGRLASSSLPGEPGNVVLAAHRDTFFRPLRNIRAGDQISLRTPQGTFPYTVDWTKVVDPSDTGVLQPTPAPSLTLVTCYPFSYIGPAPQRFIVRALPLAAPKATAMPEPPPAAPPLVPRRRLRKPQPVVASVAIAEEPPAPRRGVKRVFHKLVTVFSPRAKMQ